ncbi:MAG: AmmeMemoRadiSam system protein B [Polyangia bacterium]
MVALTEHAGRVRPPAVAGTFYPAASEVLSSEVRKMLHAARPQKAARERLKALIAPHAGYIYSGPVAASAYALLAERRPLPTRIVLLGPAHFVGFRGLALPGVDTLETPLGRIPLDRNGVAAALSFPQVCELPRAHTREHSLEVHLPFLQAVLPSFTIVPLLVGDAAPWEVAEVLAALWGGDETVIVVSSDLSHYHPYDVARTLDSETARRIVARDYGDLEGEQACGAAPLRGLLYEATQRCLEVHLCDLRSSGDTAGDRSRVVGYGSFALTEPEPSPTARSGSHA